MRKNGKGGGKKAEDGLQAAGKAKRDRPVDARTDKAVDIPRSGPGSTYLPRLAWLDATKGISMLLIVFFHFFGAYGGAGYPWPVRLHRLPAIVSECAPSLSLWDAIGCSVGALAAALFQMGPQAVGVFILLSGFGLTYSIARKGTPAGGWKLWYRRRLIRLFPMYWLAHLVYLVSPFVHRQDPLDYRFLLSFLGNRVFPIDKIFYYLVPSWWFFGLLIELYLAFPLLFYLLRKFGPLRFTILCGFITIVSRYMLFAVLEANAGYIQGAFFAARLSEFAAGMTLAHLYSHYPEAVEKRLFSGLSLLGGIVVYNLGLLSYQPGFTYVFTDALVGVGLFVIIAHIAQWIAWRPTRTGDLFSRVGAYSYGIYLLHQPYVIYVGNRMGELGFPAFMVCSILVVSIISYGSVLLERSVNLLIRAIQERHEASSVSS